MIVLSHFIYCNTSIRQRIIVYYRPYFKCFTSSTMRVLIHMTSRKFLKCLLKIVALNVLTFWCLWKLKQQRNPPILFFHKVGTCNNLGNIHIEIETFGIIRNIERLPPWSFTTKTAGNCTENWSTVDKSRIRGTLLECYHKPITIFPGEPIKIHQRPYLHYQI